MKRNLKKTTKLVGIHSDISGDVTGIRGDASGIIGDVDKCDISDEERINGINIDDLISL